MAKSRSRALVSTAWCRIRLEWFPCKWQAGRERDGLLWRTLTHGLSRDVRRPKQQASYRCSFLSCRATTSESIRVYPQENVGRLRLPVPSPVLLLRKQTVYAVKDVGMCVGIAVTRTKISTWRKLLLNVGGIRHLRNLQGSNWSSGGRVLGVSVCSWLTLSWVLIGTWTLAL